MELLSSPFNSSSPKKQHGVRSKYHQVDGKCHRKNMKITKFGCSDNKKCWKIKKIPKLRLRMISPSKIWSKLKNAYLNMMLNVAGNDGSLNNNGKRIPKARKVHPTYTNQEFQDRLVFEIYKNMMASRELATD